MTRKLVDPEVVSSVSAGYLSDERNHHVQITAIPKGNRLRVVSIREWVLGPVKTYYEVRAAEALGPRFRTTVLVVDSQVHRRAVLEERFDEASHRWRVTDSFLRLAEVE